MIALPGSYYFRTRYSSDIFLFAIYLSKYWGSILLFYFLAIYKFDFLYLPFVALALLVYFTVYDYFSYSNDCDPLASTKRKGGVVLVRPTIFKLVFLSAIGFAAYNTYFFFPLAVNLLIAFVFFVHNRINENYRVITFFLLYFLKPFIFLIDISNIKLLVVFSFFYGLAYVPYYIIKKFRLQVHNKLLLVLLSGIFLKTMFLTFFSLFYNGFIFILLLQIGLTALEFKYKSKQ